MSYLIHFNKNHSSKDGRFVSGDGDGDGIANDHKYRKDRWAIKKGYQNKNGSLTDKGKQVLKSRRQYESSAKSMTSEMNKLKKVNKQIRNVANDHESYVEDVIEEAKKYGVNTKALESALKNYKSSSYEQASAGATLCNRMKDVNVDYLNKKL